MYRILIQYFYYAGTLNARRDHYMIDWENSENVLTFSSVEEAISFLSRKGITFKVSPQHFLKDGDYTLNYGEYSRPSYKITKRRSPCK